MNGSYLKHRQQEIPPASVSGLASCEKPLDVTVISTSREATSAALKVASRLARGLGARLTLLLPQVVSYRLPLTRPQVDISHLHRVARSLMPSASMESDLAVNVCLCRSLEDCLKRVLPAGSLVVMGGRGSWWARAERRLARRVTALGNEVILVLQ